MLAWESMKHNGDHRVYSMSITGIIVHSSLSYMDTLMGVMPSEMNGIKVMIKGRSINSCITVHYG